MGSFWGYTQEMVDYVVEEKSVPTLVEVHNQYTFLKPTKPAETVRMDNGEVWMKQDVCAQINHATIWKRVE